jgi:hypothetical protein
LRSTLPDRGAGVSHRADTIGVGLSTDDLFLTSALCGREVDGSNGGGLTCRGQMRLTRLLGQPSALLLAALVLLVAQPWLGVRRLPAEFLAVTGELVVAALPGRRRRGGSSGLAARDASGTPSR